MKPTYDVLVVGAGPAGCAAAIAAARLGATTLLIEMTGLVGGMGTAGLVPCFSPFSDGVRHIHKGIARDVISRLLNTSVFEEAAQTWNVIQPERLARIYDDLLQEAGVEVLNFAMVCSLEKSADSRLDALQVITKNGLVRFSAHTVIDATGDGDVAALAGAEWVQGGPERPTMPASHCFRLGNVCTERLHEAKPWPALARQLQDNPKYDLIQTPHCIGLMQAPGIVGFNAGHIWDADITRPDRLSDCMRLGRRLAQQYRDGLAELRPDLFKDSVVLSTAPLLGVRESRRIAGEYILTADDYFARRSFEDQIACNCYPIDIHQSKQEAESRTMETVMSRYQHFGAGEHHGIPYRSLVVKGFKNLLTAGRCISCERVVQGSLRVMPVCLSTGEAAGTAAALMAKAQCCAQETNVKQLQETLLKQGAFLG
jgi:hypothetical protein